MQLLTSLNEGSREAFSVIYERYWFKLYRLAYKKLDSKEAAEELVQDIFVGLWQKRETLEIRQLENYLFRAVKYSVIDIIESKAVHEKFVAYYEVFTDQTDQNADEDLALVDLTEAIEKGLMDLPEKSQEVFKLSRFNHLTIPEIAQKLSLSEKAVEYHLSKALKVLRVSLRHFATSFLLFLVS